jgi:hypothetical protein
LLIGFAVRSSRHPAAVVEPGLFRVRSFAFAFADVGVFLFALASARCCWPHPLSHRSVGLVVLRAGIAVTPVKAGRKLTRLRRSKIDPPFDL